MSVGSSIATKIRVLIADDHHVVRIGLRSLLGRQPDMEVVGEAQESAELRTRIDQLSPDVVVTDLRMPGGGVLECIRGLQGDSRAPDVVIFTAFDDATHASQALAAGAAGYVLKQAPETHLLTAIRRARAGRRFVEEPVAVQMAEECTGENHLERAALLSARETAVLELVARGYTGRQIATELGLRLGTVETYRHRLRKKLGLRSRADVVEFARTSAKLREPP
jgi:two-component system response regulator NreC